jgi:MFS family permease
MEVRTLPPSGGWAWLREGLTLYRRQAFAFTALVILYTMTLLLVASVPVVGLPLAAVLVPFGTLGLTAAGRDAERGVMPLPSQLLSGFRSPQRAGLWQLGAVHAGLIFALTLLTSLLARDEVRQWKIEDGRVDPASIASAMPWDAMLATAFLYTPILMLTWFAPQLVAWHRQPVGKALFFSLVACWRNRWPFVVLALALFGLMMAASLALSLVQGALGGVPGVASMLLALATMVLTSVAYSTQYPIYRTVIEQPTVLDPPAPSGPRPGA